MTRFFGFAFSASMLPAGDVRMTKRELSVDEVRTMLPDCELCLNPFHAAIVTAARERFNLPVDIPEQPARIALGPGDSVVAMQVSGLPRLTDRREYTAEEIESASFRFMEVTIMAG